MMSLLWRSLVTTAVPVSLYYIINMIQGSARTLTGCAGCRWVEEHTPAGYMNNIVPGTQQGELHTVQYCME